MDLDKLRKMSQEGQSDMVKKVLQLCNPQKIAQDLISDLEKNATKCAKEGKRSTEASFVIYREPVDYDVYFKHNIGKDNLFSENQEEMSRILFNNVRKYISDNDIQLSFDFLNTSIWKGHLIKAKLSW